METLTIHNWHYGCFPEIQTYLLSAAALIKLIKLQRYGFATPYPENDANIPMDASGARKVLTFTVGSLVNQWMNANNGAERVAALEFLVADGKVERTLHSVQANDYDRIQCSSLIISYREKTKPILIELFPKSHSTIDFLRAMRDIFAHGGRYQGKACPVWRGIDFSELKKGDEVHPQYFSSGDAILLMHDIDQLIGTKWDSKSESEQIEIVRRLDGL